VGPAASRKLPWLALLGALAAMAPAHSAPARSAPAPAAAQTAPAKPSAPADEAHRREYVRKSLVDVSNARRVNVAQLEEALRESHGRGDREVAHQLALLDLTQRFSQLRLQRWLPSLPGKRSRQALTVLADASSFLPLPQMDLLSLPVPSLQDQRKMLSEAIETLSRQLRDAPSLIARQSTTLYEEVDPDDQQRDLEPTWRHLSTHSATLHLLHGDGIDPRHKSSRNQSADSVLAGDSGAFGSALAMVLRDSTHGQVEWSHWEQGAAGPLAVFRYSVPREHSHYEISYDTVTEDYRHQIVQRATAYHGVLSVDPSSRAILRVTVEALPGSDSSLRRSDMATEYQPIQVGAATCNCPVHIVNISRGWTIQMNYSGQVQGFGDLISILDDSTITDYREPQSNSGR